MPHARRSDARFFRHCAAKIHYALPAATPRRMIFDATMSFTACYASAAPTRGGLSPFRFAAQPSSCAASARYAYAAIIIATLIFDVYGRRCHRMFIYRYFRYKCLR